VGTWTSPSWVASWPAGSRPMCRWLAYQGEDAPLAPLIYGGEHSLLRQSWAPRELLSGSVNADGWGVVWWAEGAPRRLAGSRPLWQEEGLQDVLEVTRSRCALAALRNTTPGIPGDSSGTPPLVREGWGFVLNGYVPGFRRRHMRALREGLSDARYATLRGSSDTETLFLRVLEALAGGATPSAALRQTAEAVVARLEEGEEAQLTMALSDGTGLTALSTSSVARTNSLYLARRHPVLPGAVLASEALEDGAEWTPVPEHAVVRLEAGGAKVEKEGWEG